MNNLKLLLAIVSFAILCVSCNKKVKSEQGGIDIISNVYFKASKGLDQMKTFHLSKLNYSGDQIIEIIPDYDFSDIPSAAYYINDSLAYKIDQNEIGKLIIADIKKNKALPIAKKTEGTLFLNEVIPNYRNRKNLSDTILFKKTYKRFEINSPWSYTRYYIVKTDTILPYSVYKHAEEDYGGRMERIDSYNKKEDIFITMQLIPRKQLDSEAKEFFDYNQFISKSTNKVK